jgi:predicted nucleic acid-binding Zn ribbon protein
MNTDQEKSRKPLLLVMGVVFLASVLVALLIR